MSDPLPDRDAAMALLCEYTQKPGLIKHALSVEAAMRAYADRYGEDPHAWGLTGLMHDFDYERWPTLGDHPNKGAAILAATAPGEHLTFRVRRFDDRFGIGVTRPKSTILAGKEDLLDPDFTIGGADRALLGLGFSLRLINGLVGIAGGALEIDEGHFTLSIPLRAE